MQIMLTIDLRVKNSAPPINPLCSAHEQVRALSAQPTRGFDGSSSSRKRSKRCGAITSNIEQCRVLTPSVSLQNVPDGTEEYRGYEAEFDDDFSSDADSQGCKTTLRLQDLTPPAATVPCTQYSPVPMSAFNKAENCLAFPPSPNHMRFSGKDQEIAYSASSNLEQAEYEELLRVYREKVW